jgi:hypothetical protein
MCLALTGLARLRPQVLLSLIWRRLCVHMKLMCLMFRKHESHVIAAGIWNLL